MSQSLLKEKRFLPFFLTQFFGAFNDNVFKNALIILIVSRATSESESGFYTNLAGGIFILPFLLFSHIAGPLADKYEKSFLIRIIKAAEIVIMLLGAVGFLWGDLPFLLTVLFLMGTHSTFFGPLKYSILPVHLKEEELMKGTSLVEMGTFTAIILGTIVGGVLVQQGVQILSFGVILFAIFGWVTSRQIPAAPASDPNLSMDLNPKNEIRHLIEICSQKKSIYLSILAISWFWFLGASILGQLPIIARFYLHGDESMVTLLLAVFSLSVAFGSIVSEKVSDRTIELGIVPIGALGLSFFIFDIGFQTYQSYENQVVTAFDFLWNYASFSSYRIIFDLSMVGFFGSFFIVPLYALLQQRSDPENCSRVIAANNILNAIFMVASAIFLMVFFAIKLTALQICMVISVMNLSVAWYIFSLLPEFMIRFCLWVLAKTFYVLRYQGRENIPKRGPALLVANHVSYVDWLILTAACQRPVRFIVDEKFYKYPILNTLFKYCRCIPIPDDPIDLDAKKRGQMAILKALSEDDIVCIFPEGLITYDGKLNPFRSGVETVQLENQVPIIPIGLKGLWGSFFSRHRNKLLALLPLPTLRRIEVRIGEPISSFCSAEKLQEKVAALLAPPMG